MAAVIRQVLMDGEARRSSVTQTSTTFGKQREPVIRLTGPARAFPATNYAGTYTQLTGVNANKLRVVTSAPNDFNSGFTISLDFRGNYTSTNPPSPYTNPTSTAYGVNSTLAITRTSTDIASIGISTPCRVVTTSPHGLVNGNAVIISGITGGAFTAPLTTQRTITKIDDVTFDVNGVNCTTAPTSVTSAKMVSNPCKVTTAQPHGLSNGDQVTISSLGGGTFSPNLNGTFTVTPVIGDSSSFTVASNCTAAATVNTGNIVGANTLDVTATGMANVTYSQNAGSNLLTINTNGPGTNVVVPGTTVNIASIAVGNPCIVTTVAAHNLVSTGVVTIAGVSDGLFSTAINGTFVPTVTGTNTFTVPVDCTAAATTGNSTKNIRSKVYLSFLTQTTAGGAAIPTDGVFEVQTTPTGSTFTISTADLPSTARAGNVLLPRLTTSYSPQSSNTIVQFNNNVNHNMLVGQNVWVDVPVVGTPLTDAEYTLTETADEDHFKTSYLPAATNGGVYPKPSGANNGVTIYPLVPPPLGRSGVVTVNQSTFNLGSTEGSLTQSPLNSPTVFNFFFPDYKFPGSLANNGLDSPEFQLTTDSNITNLTNSLTNMFVSGNAGNSNANGLTSFNNGGGSVVMDIGSYLDDSRTANATNIGLLADDLAKLLIGAPLEGATRTAIVNFVSSNTNFPLSSPPTNPQKRDRVRAIIHLIITSAEYAVQK